MRSVNDEGINDVSFALPVELAKDTLQKAIQHVLAKIDQNLNEFTNFFPTSSSRNQRYGAIENTEWTASFWTGILWLAYEVTAKPIYRQVAEVHLKSFKRRIDEQINVNHHDLGFLYTLSCVSAYKLTGNQEALNTAIKAADHLIQRHFEQANIIQAWGDLNDPKQKGRMIIDCLLNLPLLYWVAQETGDRNYYKIAYLHAKQSAKYLVRENASTYHTFYMDVVTGEPLGGKTHQGFCDDSCWARGQAWGIYGFALSYRYTQDDSFLKIARKLANYLLNRLPHDKVCYWDLIFSDGNQERDSSAAAIAVCGLLELVKHLALGDEHRRLYENAALTILKSLIENYSTQNTSESNGLLLHGVYNKPKGVGVDECCIWGDYFYFEALVRAIKDWNLYW